LLGTGFFVSGLDLEVERFRAATPLARTAIGSSVVDNDIFALLRTGTQESNGIAVVVCGTGINYDGGQTAKALDFLRRKRSSGIGAADPSWVGKRSGTPRARRTAAVPRRNSANQLPTSSGSPISAP